MTVTGIEKSPIIYYGGKDAIKSHLHEMEPVHDVYTEVFIGGGTFLWTKSQVKNETINDINDIVVNFYQVCRGIATRDKLKRLIDETCYSRSLHQQAGKILQKAAVDKKYFQRNKVEIAWAFWMRANFSYSRKLDAGLSFSNDQCSTMPDAMQNKKESFTEVLLKRIEHIYIENDEAINVLRSRNVKKAFHYLDPSYFFGPNNAPADHGHYKNLFTLEHYEEILNWCATECKGLFLLSNYNSEILDRYVNDYGWFKKEITHRLKAPRKSGKEKIEVLVSNYDTPCGTLNLFKP